MNRSSFNTVSVFININPPNKKFQQTRISNKKVPYLGSKISSDGKSVREIKKTRSVLANFFCDKHKLITSKKIHHNIEKRFHVYRMWRYIDFKHG